MSALERAADLVPERAVPTARKWFYLLNPTVSWRKRRKVDETTEAFAERFFGSEAAYRAHRSEFFEGRIVDICVQGDRALPAEESVYDAHRDECAKLYALVREREPDVVVETGVYHGVSTAAILLGLDANDRGTLYSIDASHVVDVGGGDHDDHRNSRAGRGGEAARTGTGEVDAYYADYIQRSRPSCSEAGAHDLPADRDPGWILPDDLRERWHLTEGRPHRVLPDLLDDVGPADLFFHDSLHATGAMLFEFELAWEHLAGGGLLASCHVGNNDAMETFASEHGCEHGLFSFDYNGLEGYDAPCSCGYAVKPGEGSA